jgi:hypothetical protein
MKKMNMPGFMAESSSCKSLNYQFEANQKYKDKKGIVISQMRIGSGRIKVGGGLGFWKEAGCAILCSPLLENPPIYAACVVTCIG